MERLGAPIRVPFVCHLAAGHAYLGRFARPSRSAQVAESLQSQVFKVRPPAQASHGDRTPSFAVMWCRLKCRTQKTAIYRDFATGRADAGTRTRTPSLRARLRVCDRLRLFALCPVKGRLMAGTGTKSLWALVGAALPPRCPRIGEDLSDLLILVGALLLFVRRAGDRGRPMGQSTLAEAPSVGEARLGCNRPFGERLGGHRGEPGRRDAASPELGQHGGQARLCLRGGDRGAEMRAGEEL